MAPGIGLRVADGTQTRWTGGSARFNSNTKVFTPDGQAFLPGVGKGTQAYADRYTGGNLEASRNVPSVGAELESFIPGALKLAKEKNIPLPQGLSFAPGDWNNEPTQQEISDAAWTLNTEWIGNVLWFNSGSDEGKYSDKPMQQSRMDSPYKFFTEMNQVFRKRTYIENTYPNAKGFSPDYPISPRPKDSESVTPPTPPVPTPTPSPTPPTPGPSPVPPKPTAPPQPASKPVLPPELDAMLDLLTSIKVNEPVKFGPGKMARIREIDRLLRSLTVKK